MKVLIVGLGSIASKHIAALFALQTLEAQRDCASDFSSDFFDEVKIYALRRDANCSQVDGVVNVFSREEALALDADFAIVSNPTSEHLGAIEWLAELTIPLFIEKPIFDKIVQLPHINALTYVACNLRFLECLQWVKNNVGSKRVNEVNCYCGSYLPTWRSGGDWRKVYSANKEMGGGVHIDLIHEIDYLYWIFGKPTSVNKLFRSCSSLDISAIDYANYTMIYDNFAASVVLNYFRRDYKRTLEIVFEDTTWLVDLAENKVVDTSFGGVLFSSDQKPNDTYLAQMKYFTNLVHNNAIESFNSAKIAVDVLKICLEDETTK